MDKALFEKIAKEYHGRERERAVSHDLHKRIDPVILGAYLLSVLAVGLWYFSAWFLGGSKPVFWLLAGFSVGIPVILSLLHKCLYTPLFPKAEAKCTVPVMQWSQERFKNMAEIHAEEQRLHRAYRHGIFPPALAFLLAPASLVFCYEYTGKQASEALPKGHLVTLILLCLFYGVYGLIVVLLVNSKSDPKLSPEASSALKEYKKELSKTAQTQRAREQEEHRVAEEKQQLEAMIRKAMGKRIPDFSLLLEAHSQGSREALNLIARSLIPLVMDKTSIAYTAKDDHNVLRHNYVVILADFEQRLTEELRKNDPELEFAFTVICHKFRSSIPWKVLQTQSIPRLKELMSSGTLCHYPEACPEELLRSMEYLVFVYTAPAANRAPLRGSSLTDKDHDVLDSLQEDLVAAGIIDPPDYSDM